jgi:hypothetical protein
VGVFQRQSGFGEARGKSFASSADRTSVVQSVVKYYTDWATTIIIIIIISLFWHNPNKIVREEQQK